jgi:carboxypeptidase family protein/TonB-dependent receptor-like protein
MARILLRTRWATATVTRFVFLLCAFVLTAGPAQAQSVSGSISGNVVDASKQIVPGALVTLIDEQTGATRTTTSGDGGRFVFSAIQPGRYAVKVELTGFSIAERRAIILPANEQLSLGTFELQIGALSETVTTTAETTLVQTASSVRSAMLTDTQLETLAVRGRDVISMLRVLPGVSLTSQSEAVGGSLGTTTPNIGGGRNTWNTVTVDGVVGNDLGSPQVFSSTVNLDAISEVKVQLNNYAAEYGRNGGSQVTLITKSGTQQFKGSLYGYKRTEQWNANDFFNNLNGIPKPLYRYSTVGATLGGPVLLPKRAARDKLFFFYSFENWDTLTPNPVREVTTPTALERAGDFSQSRGLDGNLIIVRDPLTGRPFADNKIPASRINPNGQALLGVFPLPNQPDRSITAGNYNYQFQESIQVPRRQHLIRMDYRPSSKDALYARYSRWFSDNRGYGVAVGSANWGLLKQHYTFVDNSAILNYTRVLNTTTVNELSVGYRYSTEAGPEVDPAELQSRTRAATGYTLGQFNPSINPFGLVPRAEFGGFIPNAAEITWAGRFPVTGVDEYFTVNDSLSYTRGSHTLKAGFYLELVRNKEGNQADQFAGGFDFARDTSNPLDSGHPYANAMLGVFRSYTEQTSRPGGDGTANTFEWFVQDSWKAAPKLTIDLGMRFSTYTYYVQKQLASAFSIERFDSAKAPLLYAPAIVNGVRVARNPATGQTGPAVLIGGLVPGTGDITNGMVLNNDPNYPNGFIENPSVLYEPRFGMSYDVSGDAKTALRASVGVFHSTRSSANASWNTSRQPPVQFSPTIFYSTMDNLLQSTGVNFPSNATGFTRESKTPVVYSFSGGLQRAIGWNTVLDVAYVGSRGRNLIQARNVNTIPFGARFDPANEDPTRPGNPLPDIFLRPYRGWGTLNVFEHTGISDYNALQVQANRRYANRFQFGAAYTLSRSRDYTSGDGGGNLPIYQDVRDWTYGLSSFDAPHVLVVNYTWDLPKLSALVDHPIVRATLDNWQLSGISSVSSGNPAGISFTTVDNVDLLGGGDTPIQVVVTGDPNLPSGERTLERWFDTSVFARPAKGQIGNGRKDVIRLPGVNDTGLTITKLFPFSAGRRSAQIRWEMYNLFNSTQYNGVDTTARFDAQGRQVNTRFGQVTSTRGPRVMQGSVRLTF